MARNKNFLDWTEFTTPASGRDLQQNSIRKTLKYDVYQDKTKFKAIALTDMHPLSQETTDKLIASGYDWDKFETDYPDVFASLKNVRWVFRARILGNDSPHHFIPDPCDTTYVRTKDDMATAMSYVQMHTQFITPTDYEMDNGDDLVSQGDIVWVELDKNVAGYELQMGRFISKIKAEHVSDYTGAGTGGTVEWKCDNIQDIFNERDAERIPSGEEGLQAGVAVPARSSPSVTAQLPTPPPAIVLIPTLVGTQSSVFGSPGLTPETQLQPSTLTAELAPNVGVPPYVAASPALSGIPAAIVRTHEAWSRFYWPLVERANGISRAAQLAAPLGKTKYLTGDIGKAEAAESDPHTRGADAIKTTWNYRTPRAPSKCDNRGNRFILDLNRHLAFGENQGHIDSIIRSRDPLDPKKVKAMVERVAVQGFAIPPPYEGQGLHEGTARRPPDPRVLDMIKTFWDYIEVPQFYAPTPGKCSYKSQYCWLAPHGMAWSAAYISYIVHNVDPTFEAAASHNKYAKAGALSRGVIPKSKPGRYVERYKDKYPKTNWKIYSLTHETVEIAVGDVLIEDKHYKTSDHGASHADVVWKITGFPGEEILWLAGGNLSGTNTTYIQIPAPNRLLGKLGANAWPITYSSCSKYKVVLKRMHVPTPIEYNLEEPGWTGRQ